eukprot:863152-Ditylum_brightwellii.AAC.2
MEFMNKVLPEPYKQIRPEHKLEGYEYPVHVLPKTTRTQSSCAEGLKNKYGAANPQEESTKCNQPLEREQKRRAMKLYTEEFPGLVPDAVVVQSLEAQENKNSHGSRNKKIAAAAEAEPKKTKIAMEAELKKAKIAAEQSTNKVKTMQVNLEAMKTEITTALRYDLSTM